MFFWGGCVCVFCLFVFWWGGGGGGVIEKHCVLLFMMASPKWKPLPRYWPFLGGNHRSSVDSPHKGQWQGALFSLICAKTIGWENNRDAGYSRRHRVHYDVTVIVGLVHDIHILVLQNTTLANASASNFGSISGMEKQSQIARFMGPTWGPSGSCRPQMGPMLAPWTLLSGMFR